jgi:hypothetical protein
MERLRVLLPGEAVHRRGLLTGDAIDERPFPHHDFEDFAFPVGVE